MDKQKKQRAGQKKWQYEHRQSKKSLWIKETNKRMGCAGEGNEEG